MKQTIGKLLQSSFVKFCVVGAICTLIDAATFYILHSVLGYRLAMICGFCLSIGVNYLLNIYWAFSAKPNIKNAISILSAHCFNIFIVRMGLMWLFINLFMLSESIAFIPTLCISIVTNYIIIRLVVRKFR